MQVDVPVSNGQFRLLDHKVLLGSMNPPVEHGSALQKFVREGDDGSWRDIGWGTNISIGEATQVVLRYKGVEELKNWGLHNGHFDI